MYGEVAYKPFCWIEWCLASILALNALYHVISYVVATLSIQPVVLSPRQRKLLGVTENDPLFKNEVPPPQTLAEPSSPQHFSTMNLSWRSNTLSSPGLDESSKLAILGIRFLKPSLLFS